MFKSNVLKGYANNAKKFNLTNADTNSILLGGWEGERGKYKNPSYSKLCPLAM